MVVDRVFDGGGHWSFAQHQPGPAGGGGDGILVVGAHRGHGGPRWESSAKTSGGHQGFPPFPLRPLLLVNPPLTPSPSLFAGSDRLGWRFTTLNTGL